MDIPVHNALLWQACLRAQKQLQASAPIANPCFYYPLLVRGSWMNDTNQGSILLDKAAGKPAAAVTMQRFFRELWRQDLAELVARMKGAGVTAAMVAAQDPAPWDVEAAGDIAGFGGYTEYDHLDVPTGNSAEQELGKWNLPEYHGRSQTVHKTVGAYVRSRVQRSTLNNVDSPEARLGVAELTELGKALHTVQDFFGHSNYIELLLWSLAWRNELDRDIVAAFTTRHPFVDETEELGPFCPLPATAGEIAATAGSNVMLWYGPSPGETPLCSTLFDMRDTVYSLLGIYVKHLERTSQTVGSSRELDLLMAVFDFPGRPIVKGVWSIYQKFTDVLESVGKAVRGAMADEILRIADTHTGTAKDVLAASAMVVRRYDSADAAHWAKAGRLRYVRRVIEEELTLELDDKAVSSMTLPHHSLLSKDTLPRTSTAALRFRLACSLSVEVSANLLAWHFSGKPAASGYAEMSDRLLIHPWQQLEQGMLSGAGLAPVIAEAFGEPWPLNAATRTSVFR